MYAYITEFEKFLNWLISNRLAVENVKVVSNICGVPITTLENLPLNEARTFQRYLQGEGIETRAINRTFSALKSLFMYLAQNTENENRGVSHLKK